MNRAAAPDAAAARLAEIIRRADDLPAMPHVVAALLESIDDPEVTIHTVQTIIGKDPALAAKVLRLANSAFYGFPREVATIREAVLVLGLRTVRALALAASAASVMGLALPAYRLGRFALWRHSVLVGTIARRLARDGGEKTSEIAFAAGLLHDVGKILLDRVLAPHEAEIHAAAAAASPAAAERAVLGFDHADVGRLLVAKWRLPEALEAAAGFHHRPGAAPEAYRFLAEAVSCADWLAHRATLAKAAPPEAPPADVAERWNLGGRLAEAKEAAAEVDEWAERLGTAA
jgi:HD-like signal output (HDOD) protein